MIVEYIHVTDSHAHLIISFKEYKAYQKRSIMQFLNVKCRLLKNYTIFPRLVSISSARQSLLYREKTFFLLFSDPFETAREINIDRTSTETP